MSESHSASPAEEEEEENVALPEETAAATAAGGIDDDEDLFSELPESLPPFEIESSHQAVVEELPPTTAESSDTSIVPVRVGHKRRAVDKAIKAGTSRASEEAEDEEGIVCNICMEAWTNSGEHRICSLKCGHFFGQACIEKWMKGGSSSCPNCNEKAQKRDLRAHFVARLMAIDTSERDRAVAELEKARMEQRQLELELTTAKVTLKMQAKEIDRLKQELGTNGPSTSFPSLQQPEGAVSAHAFSSTSAPACSGTLSKLTYLKRLDLIRSELSSDNRDKCCRVMAYNDFHGMLVVSQPSFTALAPGYGVRKINMLDQKAGSFLPLHKEPIRDLCFNPVRQDQLLSASQEKCVKLTNISTGQVVQKYLCDSEAWSCCWDLDDLDQFFVGTKRSQVLLFDTRDSVGSSSVAPEPKMQLEFPIVERRPIIGLAYVPAQPQCHHFPCSGLLVLTLGSLWFFERVAGHGDSPRYKAHKLPVEGLFWSMRFDCKTRMLLVSTKPMPFAKHMVCEINVVNVSEDPLRPDLQCTCNVIYEQKKGGSYSERAFMRSTLFTHPSNDQQMLLVYCRGSGGSDHRVVLQELGVEVVKDTLSTQKSALDMCPLTINGERLLAILCETDLIIYKWT